MAQRSLWSARGLAWRANVPRIRERTRDWTLIFLSCGFVLTMVAYGWFQERLSLYPVPAPFVVLVNNLAAALVAYVGTQREVAAIAFPRAAWNAIVVSAGAMTVDSTLRYAALRRLPFTAVLVLRGLSLLPSLAFGHCFGAPSTVRDWLLTCPVIAGVVLFGWDSPLLDSAQRGYTMVVFGAAMASGAAVAEAFNTQWQSRAFRQHAAMSPLALLLRSSLCSAAISAVSIVTRGDAAACVVAIRDEPKVLGLMVAMACFASLGRVAIFEVLHRYGGFVLAVLLLVRRLLSVGLSSYIFGPELTGAQICGAAVVFASLLARSLIRGKRSSSSAVGDDSAGDTRPRTASAADDPERGSGEQRASARGFAAGGGGAALRGRGASLTPRYGAGDECDHQSRRVGKLALEPTSAHSSALEPEMRAIISSPRA